MAPDGIIVGAPFSNAPIAETRKAPLSQVLLNTIAPLPQPSEISPPIPPGSACLPAVPSRPDDASSYFLYPTRLLPPTPPLNRRVHYPHHRFTRISRSPRLSRAPRPAIAGPNPPLSRICTGRTALLTYVSRLSSRVSCETKIRRSRSRITWIGISQNSLSPSRPPAQTQGLPTE